MKNKDGINLKYLYTIAGLAAFSGFTSNYNVSAMTGALPFIKESFQLNELWLGMATASLAVGAIAGAAMTGTLPDRIGRKRTLRIAASIYLVAALLISFSFSIYDFIAYRAMTGIAVGMTSIVAPMYLAEIAPADKRGIMVTLYQLAIVIGIMFSFSFDNMCTGFEYNWRIMLGISAVPSLILFILLAKLPESPRWLIINSCEEKARHILSRIGDTGYTTNFIDQVHKSQTSSVSSSYRDLLDPRFFRIIVIGAVITVIQQWSGTNLIFSYAPFIFKSAGFNTSHAIFQTIFIGIVNFVCTLISIKLVGKFGRKTLMNTGLFFNMLSLTSIGLYFMLHLDYPLMLIISALACVASFAMTLGPVMWIQIAEISPAEVRSRAMSVFIFALWTAGMLGTFSYPMLQKSLGQANIFFLYAGICLASIFFFVKFVPETKDKTLEEIEGMWKKTL